MPPSKEVLERGYNAASAYLRRGGYIVADGTETIEPTRLFFPAIDGQELVIVDVRVTSSKGPSSTISKTRYAQLERYAKSQVEAMDTVTSYRIDIVTLLVIGIDRALLRHHRDVQP